MTKKSSKQPFIRTNNYTMSMKLILKKILVLWKESYGKKGSLKYFVGYNDKDDTIRPLRVNFHR